MLYEAESVLIWKPCQRMLSDPDFPGCITAGKNIDEAKDMAQEALAFHIQGMIEDNEQLPVPSKLEEIMNDPDYYDAVAFLVVSLPDSKSRIVRVNITMPEMTLKQIDAAEKKKGYVQILISRPCSTECHPD